ncbi:unnamed protein product [Phytophthora fragariaefolia]|uniref:Unnamed protein product n=1 Tax=Phytophthora fragariaefolia TaxID=1490495 RepID=A0A9W6UBN8_9STRA|nr:unnamed protein product [Phytophthora fragariaefolia]
MQQYEAYTIALSAFQTPANQPFVMPVMACIDGDTRRRIAMFEFGCAPETITDEQGVQYFLEANVPVARDNYLTIDEAMKSLRMNVKLKEAQSRMNQLQADMYKILEAPNLGDDMFRKAPRRIVGYLLEALQPAGFQEIVRHQLTMESNKESKKQIVPFCKWVTTMLAQYMQWNDDGRAQKPASEAKPGQRQQRGKSPHPSTPSSSTTTSSEPRSDESTAGERKRTALPCSKRASPGHSVRHCPHAQPGEAEKLIAEVRERKQAKQRLHTKKLHVSPDGGVPSGSSSEGTPTTPGHVIVVADGLEMTATLLDSGSDNTLISRAAVEALLKLDPGLDLRNAPTPAYGNPVGGQLVVLSRLALIRKVSLATSAGPLVLRNLRCWVDETDEELNITIGRPMMERLGYSEDAFLVAALTKQPEYAGGGSAQLPPDSLSMLKTQRLQYQACYDPSSSSEATPL